MPRLFRAGVTDQAGGLVGAVDIDTVELEVRVDNKGDAMSEERFAHYTTTTAARTIRSCASSIASAILATTSRSLTAATR